MGQHLEKNKGKGCFNIWKPFTTLFTTYNSVFQIKKNTRIFNQCEILINILIKGCFGVI